MRSANASTSPTGYEDCGQSENWPAALSFESAITGTKPEAMPSMTLTDSRSAIEGCTSRSADRNNWGIVEFLWKPIEAGRLSFLLAKRTSLFRIGPVPAIVR